MVAMFLIFCLVGTQCCVPVKSLASEDSGDMKGFLETEKENEESQVTETVGQGVVKLDTRELNPV